MKKFNNYFSISVIRKRLFVLICAVTFIFLFIFGKTFFVTVVEGEFLREKAIDQWTRELPVKAVRGTITDKNGVVLVGNSGTYCVYVRTRCVLNPQRVAKILSDIFNLDYNTLYEKICKKSTSEITVCRQCDDKTIDILREQEIDGVYFAPDNTRVYPFNEMLCQTLGYTSVDGTGQSGIEKYYDRYLRGTDGEILYECDLVGKDVSGKKPAYVAAVDGLSLRLTIDSDIQQICENETAKAMVQFSPKSAKILVMEPSTGKILALSQRPSFDLNDIPREDTDLLMSESRNELIVDSYEPGSTFKIITASANIEEYFSGNSNAFSLDHIFSSSRFRFVGGKNIKCWSTHAGGKHSNENLALALNNSCNPIFVDIALSLGKSKMYEYINKFNFGKTTGIDFQGEALGMVLPESSVTDGDLARIGFGQTIAVTPLQLSAAVSAAVNGGIYYKPYLVEEIYSDKQTVSKFYPTATQRVVSEKTSRTIAGYLEDVVANGSGKQAFISGYRVGGKTGTAQKYENGHISAGKNNMSFIGFFPANNPKYLALVVIDEPVGGAYGSTVAAPICKNVFNQIINIKNIKNIA